MQATTDPFERLGPSCPRHPVVVSVPHGGRDYPAALLAILAVPVASLVALEDRLVDRLAHAMHAGETMLIQRRARAWIDLNRHESDRDPVIDAGATEPVSARARGGLGLVPRRAGDGTAIWRRRLSDAEVRARIADAYRPFHDALAVTLDAAVRQFGTAVLLDLHSMPTIAGGRRAQVVIGDRHGGSADPGLIAAVERAVMRHGVAVARNAPYAGGAVVARHAARQSAVQGLQIELDRGLYLDAARRDIGAGFAATVAMLRDVSAVAAHWVRDAAAQAAE